MVNDPVADLIIRLKNASKTGADKISVPYSKFKHAVADILTREGFVLSAERKGKKVKKFLDIKLKYDLSGKPEVNDVKRISKLGKRVYLGANEIHPVKFGHGIVVISTPKGLKTDKEARKEHVGGEVLFSIW